MDGFELLRSTDQLNRGCAHEAGHVIVGLAFGLQLDYVCLLEKHSSNSAFARGATLWKDLSRQHCAVQCFVTAAGMAGEQRILGQFSDSHGKGDLEALMNGGRSADEIEGDQRIALCILKRNVKAHDALSAALRMTLCEDPGRGGLIGGEGALRIFDSNSGQRVKLEEILEAPESWQ